MKVKAIWVSINPFHPDINSLMYQKIADVPEDSDFLDLIDAAKKDSKPGYRLKSLEKINEEQIKNENET